MNLIWEKIDTKEPPENKVLLVISPLGIDLAVTIKGKWYFKSGDDWEYKNLEYWDSFLPTQWAEFNSPVEQIAFHQKSAAAGLEELLAEPPVNTAAKACF